VAADGVRARPRPDGAADRLRRTALTPLAPDAGQSATYKLTFPAPSKEGIYKVRMNLNGTPHTGYYLGNSVIDVKPTAPCF
jgi:hypothetical protein